jgi:hypothetical protein
MKGKISIIHSTGDFKTYHVSCSQNGMILKAETDTFCGAFQMIEFLKSQITEQKA